jgi:hypothetical protein
MLGCEELNRTLTCGIPEAIPGGGAFFCCSTVAPQHGFCFLNLNLNLNLYG